MRAIKVGIKAIELTAPMLRSMISRTDAASACVTIANWQAEEIFSDFRFKEARELCALMSDGEGADPEVYRSMAKQAMEFLDSLKES